MTRERYFGRWGDVYDINRDFDEHRGECALEDEEVLFASYENEDYSGHAVVLFERNGTLMEVSASHCSCYGLEGQFEPAPVTWEALALRLHGIGRSGGFIRCHSQEAVAAFCDLVMSHVAVDSGCRQ